MDVAARHRVAHLVEPHPVRRRLRPARQRGGEVGDAPVRRVGLQRAEEVVDRLGPAFGHDDVDVPALGRAAVFMGEMRDEAVGRPLHCRQPGRRGQDDAGAGEVAEVDGIGRPAEFAPDKPSRVQISTVQPRRARNSARDTA
jgi:hypothetical protein